MNKFSNAKKLNKTNIKKFPEKKPIIYRLQNESGKELYIGTAKRNRVEDRLLEHLNFKKEKISGATKVKIAQFSNLQKARKAEKQLIKKLQPKFNIEGK